MYLTIAKQWSRVMLALFAVGVVTGTILSFELGMLWPGFMPAFGEVFGLGVALEGFSFFLEAIFIAIYVYGWERLSPRIHFLTGIPILQRELRLARKSIPIVFITARGSHSIRRRLVEAGAVNCLFKPFSETALLQALTVATKNN